MKKIILYLILCSGIALFMSCEKKEAVDPALETGQAKEAKTESVQKGICPIQGLSTYKLKEGSENEFVKNNRYLEYGETVTMFEDEVEGSTGDLKMRFLKILDKNEDEMWVNQRYIIPGGQVGVIVQDDVLLYDEAKLTKYTSSMLPKGQLVGVYPEKDGQFTKLSGWNDSLYGFAQMFVKSDTVSTNEDDITAVILMDRAMNEKNDIVKEQVLNTALELNSPAFGNEIRLLLREMEDASDGDAASSGKTTEEVTERPERETEAFIMDGTIISDNVRVRDYPYENGTEVLTTLQTNQDIVIIEKTVSVYTIDGDTAPWFKINDPEGWVFGAFVELK